MHISSAIGLLLNLCSLNNQISRPLNLTANPNGSNPYFSSADTSRAYYASFALQQSGFYPGSHTFNNLGGMNIPQDFSFPNPTTSIHLSSTGVEFPSCLSTSTAESENGSKLQRVAASTRNSKTSTSSIKTHTKSSGVRGRKSISSDEMANRKRQEFNELVKARTEKLMSDGPIANVSILFLLHINNFSLITLSCTAMFCPYNYFYTYFTLSNFVDIKCCLAVLGYASVQSFCCFESFL
ncbi:unnamed protein product [Schistosoma curassoni]|uniref:RFXA_RFXANK_bdg domain-containing protein n=1 Tax=Schistosoma curassoni TaxID=6186 RepID=A0A183JVA4_9TREM|nr:unnamed protein product [Schistosoma curassoni]